MKTTHRSAIDDLATCTTTTYCGMEIYIGDTDGIISQDPTCSECKKELLKDRKARGRARKDDPNWLKHLLNKEII